MAVRLTDAIGKATEEDRSGREGGRKGEKERRGEGNRCHHKLTPSRNLQPLRSSRRRAEEQNTRCSGGGGNCRKQKTPVRASGGEGREVGGDERWEAEGGGWGKNE